MLDSGTGAPPDGIGACSTWPAVLLGLVGAGIGASRTPRLHEREAAEQGLRCIYKLIDLDDPGLGPTSLPDILTAAERLGFAGLNVTHPCKQAIIPLLDELSPEAAALGAVNTVVLGGGKRVGHNTDGWGFAESFRRELGHLGRDRVLQFGAGGAGAAVAHALLTLGTGEVVLVEPDEARGSRLASALCARFGPTRATACAAAPPDLQIDGIVNATPLGMAAHPGMAAPASLLRPERWIAEIVYFPLETELLREARARGCVTMSGGGMAAFQAAAAFRLFTGREADAERMLRHFDGM